MNPGDVIQQPQGDTEGRWLFWCPACECAHSYTVPRWSWNGSTTRPTFSPSLRYIGNANATLCHLFVTEGQIIYCGDNPHKLNGQTVPMIPWDKLRDSWDETAR